MRTYLLKAGVVVAFASAILFGIFVGSRMSGVEAFQATPPWNAMPTNRPGPPPQGEGAYRGIIRSVSQSSLVMVETTTGSEMAFRVGSGASIVRNGNPATLAQLRAGDSVRVVTDSDGRDLLVTSVEAGGQAG